MLAEEVADITLTDRLIVLGIAVQILIGIALWLGQRRLAKNQVEIASLVKKGGA